MTQRAVRASGTVYRFILLSDIAGSSRLAEEYPEAYAAALAEHNALITRVVAECGGEIYKNTGDGYFAFFESAPEAVACARQLALGFAGFEALAGEAPFLVRLALHGGELRPAGSEYFGPALNRVSRICQVCHPGQVLLSGAVAAALGEPRDGLALLDFGRHFLRDLAEPEQLYQLDHPSFTQRSFPPLATLNNRPNNLVSQPNRFIGRERELQELSGLLLHQQRLVTLVAPGGYGKSRLAAQLCATLLPHVENGVFMVYLAPVRESLAVPLAVAAALGCQLSGRRSAEQQLCDYLRGKELLLCLDNFEHLLERAMLVAQLLQVAPRLKVLVTSREPLRIQGEVIYRLDPLTTHGATEDSVSEAVRLFADRVALVKAGFAVDSGNIQLLTHICEHLSGIPLAIELAAAWMDTFTLNELHDELASELDIEARSSLTEARHHSLRSCLNWSWNLLGAQQQELLLRLSVFRGGFFSEAAAAVLGLNSMPLRQALAKLCDKSWLYTREVDHQTRFFMRDMLAHEYVFAKLEEHRETGGAGGAEAAAACETAPQPGAMAGPSHANLYDQAVSAHAAYFAALALREGPRLGGGGVPDGGAVQRQALRCWQLELENFSQAQDSALELGTTRWLRPIAAYLKTFLDSTSAFSLAYERYRALDAAARELGDPVLELQTRLGLGRAQLRLGKPAEARVLLEQALELALHSGERQDEAAVLNSLGTVHYLLGDYDRAATLQRESRALCRETGERRGEAVALNSLGVVHRFQGDFVRAAELYSQALAIFRDIGDRVGEAGADNSLGNVHYSQGDYARATELYRQALAIRREIGDRHGEANALSNLGYVHLMQGDYARAMELHHQHLIISREIGERRGEANALSCLGNAHYAQGEYANAAEMYTQALELLREIGERHGEANALNGLGNAHRMQGDNARAAELYRQSLAIFREIGGRQGEAYAFSSLGHVHYAQGDYARAAELFGQALAICREIGERRGEASDLLSLGLVHRAQGGHARAAQLYIQALAIFRELNARDGIAVTCALAGALLAASKRWSAAVTALYGATALAAGLGYKFDADEIQEINPGLAGIESAAAAGEISSERVAAWRTEGEALSFDALAKFVLDELALLNHVCGKATAPAEA